MSRYVHLKVVFDDDWERGDIWAPDGVMSGAVSLSIRGLSILHYWPAGLNNSLVTFAKAALADHPGVPPEENELAYPNPLFYCPGALENRCGVFADFAVQHLSGPRGERLLELTNFHGCKVAPETRLLVPWAAWAAECVRVGTRVARRSPESKPGLNPEVMPRYLELRKELRDVLRALRRQLRQTPSGARDTTVQASN